MLISSLNPCGNISGRNAPFNLHLPGPQALTFLSSDSIVHQVVSLACLNFRPPNWINKASSPWEVAFNKHDFSFSTHSQLNRKYPSVVLLNVSGWSEEAEVFYKVGVVTQVSLEKIDKL